MKTSEAKMESAVIWRDNYLSWPPELTKAFSEVVAENRESVAELLRNGASTVFIPLPIEEKYTDESFRAAREEGLDFPEVKMLSVHREFRQVEEFLRPIKASVAIRIPTVFEDMGFANQLENFLQSMLIASRTKAHVLDQVKFGPLGALNTIGHLRALSQDRAVWNTLDRLEACIRAYSGFSLLRLREATPITYEDLKRIRSTDDYQTLARRYCDLGTATNIGAAIESLNQQVQKIASSPTAAKMLKLAKIGVSAASNAIMPVVSLLEFMFDVIKSRQNVEFVPTFVPSSTIGWPQQGLASLEGWLASLMKPTGDKAGEPPLT
jgi:hypothetical protein